MEPPENPVRFKTKKKPSQLFEVVRTFGINQQVNVDPLALYRTDCETYFDVQKHQPAIGESAGGVFAADAFIGVRAVVVGYTDCPNRGYRIPKDSDQNYFTNWHDAPAP